MSDQPPEDLSGYPPGLSLWRGPYTPPLNQPQLKPQVRWCISADRSCQSEFCLKEQACYQAVHGLCSAKDIYTHYLKSVIINDYLLRKSNETNPEHVAQDFLKTQPRRGGQ